MNEIGKTVDWEFPELHTICDVIYRYPTYYGINYIDSGIPEIRGQLIEKDGSITSDLTKYRYISKKTCKKFPKTILKEGDLVMTVRGTIGKVGIIPKNLEGSNITANLMRISPKSKICFSPYLQYFIKSKYFIGKISEHSTLTAIPQLKHQLLKSIKIALPSIEIQKQIVAKLDYLFKKLELYKKEIDSFSNFKILKNSESIIAKMFFDDLTDEKKFKNWRKKNNLTTEWAVHSLDDLILSTKNGKTGRPKNEPPGIPRLGITSITQQFSGIVDETESKFFQIEKSEIEQYSVVTDDVLFCRQNGNKEFVGKSAAYKGNTKPIIFSDSLIRFRVNNEKILSDYLVIYTNSTMGRNQIERYCTTTAGNYSINGANLKKIPVVLPSIDEQKYIIEIKKEKI